MTKSIIADKNNETWLAIEGNVIRVFTTKTSAVQHKLENNQTQIEVLHRYADGTLQPLLFWGNQEFIESDQSIRDAAFYSDFDDGFDADLDFYELCSDNNPVEFKD
jgi:hypothetical protein